MTDSADTVRSYTARKPNVLTSREIVADIAASTDQSVVKVRGILQKAGVYISMPKDSRKVGIRDRKVLIDALSSIDAQPDDPNFSEQKTRCLEEVANRSGYSVLALRDLDNVYKAFPRTEEQISQEWNARVAKDRRKRTEAESKISPPKEQIGSKGGPDAWGWIVILGLSAGLAMCVASVDSDADKTELQETSEKLCEAMGGCED